MKAFRFGFLLLLLGAASILFSCASSQTPSAQAPAAKAGGKNVIRIGSPFKAGSIVVDAAEKFKELMEKGSAGKWAVEVQAGKDSEENINDWNSQGKIEMQSNGHRALEIFAPKYFFFNAPYVMKDLDHLMRVWNGKLGNAAREQTIKNGNVMYLGIISRGLRQTTSKKPLYTPADAYEMKLRLPTVKTWIAVWKEIGADPIPIPLPDLFKSLKEGKADASEGDLPQIVGFNLDQVQSHLTMTNHLVQTAGMMINKKFFDGLPKQDQDLILKASRDACQWANEKMKKDESKLLLELQRKGMQVVIPDADLFRAKGKPAVEELFKTEWPVTTWTEVLAQ